MARTGMCAKLLGRTLEPKKLAKLPVVSKSVPYPSEWSSGRAARGLDHVASEAKQTRMSELRPSGKQ